MDASVISLFIPTGMEWIWLIIIGGIVIFGAKKIPEIAKSLGKAKGEFEKGQIEGTKEVKKMINSDDRLKLLKAAESLGINAEGLSDEELREAINKELSKAGK